MTAPNGEPRSELSCFVLGHDFTPWIATTGVDYYRRDCRREGCPIMQAQHVMWGYPRS